MARANRIHVERGIFHVTHRCHNQDFHLKFAKDREAYRLKMRQALQQFKVSLLDYCLTRNHVHLLVDTDDKMEVSRFMQKVAGEFAKAFNRRKHRVNAVWGDSFHATLVESGQYLQRCQGYIELNMVRCGVVSHPREWEWVGYHEIMGHRRRNRLIDVDRLCWRWGTNDIEEVRRNLAAGLQERLAKEAVKREDWWTESLAVGAPVYLEKIRPMILSRREMEIVEPESGLWVLQESPASYGTF